MSSCRSPTASRISLRAEQPRVDLGESACDLLLAVDPFGFVVDEGACDRAVLGVHAELQVAAGDIQRAALPLHQDLAVVEADEDLAPGHFGVLRHHPGDVETHSQTFGDADRHRLGGGEFAACLDGEPVVPGLHRPRWDGGTGRPNTPVRRAGASRRPRSGPRRDALTGGFPARPRDRARPRSGRRFSRRAPPVPTSPP